MPRPIPCPASAVPTKEILKLGSSFLKLVRDIRKSQDADYEKSSLERNIVKKAKIVKEDLSKLGLQTSLLRAGEQEFTTQSLCFSEQHTSDLYRSSCVHNQLWKRSCPDDKKQTNYKVYYSGVRSFRQAYHWTSGSFFSLAEASLTGQLLLVSSDIAL